MKKDRGKKRSKKSKNDPLDPNTSLEFVDSLDEEELQIEEPPKKQKKYRMFGEDESSMEISSSNVPDRQVCFVFVVTQ